MTNTVLTARIPGPFTIDIERDAFDSDLDVVTIKGNDWQGSFTVATMNHRYARKPIEATGKLMSACEDLAAALQLTVATLEREHVKSSGADAGRIWYALEQAKAAQAKAGLR